MSIPMKYFVLKPGGDDLHARASRMAMTAYATVIQAAEPEMARELRAWACREIPTQEPTSETIVANPPSPKPPTPSWLNPTHFHERNGWWWFWDGEMWLGKFGTREHAEKAYLAPRAETD